MIFIFLGVISEENKDFVNKIFLKMHKQMYHISYNILKSKADAEEAVAETFLKIIENINKIAALPCPQIEPYCVIILKNESINIVRKRKKIVDIEDIEHLGYDSHGYSIEDEVIEIVDWNYLIDHIERLTHDEKDFVQLRFYKEMSYKEIADFFSISEEAAKKRGQRILKKLCLFYEGGEENVQSS